MNVLVFFAHPDDETMLAGGMLALLASAGAQVHYLCATRGEGGELGEPPLCSRDAAGTVRAQELVCAVQALGGSSLAFLDYLDPLVGPDDTLYPFCDNLEELAQAIVTNIREVQADAVVTHGAQGEYGHPAHVLCHQAARQAVESLGTAAPNLYVFQAAYPEHPKPRLANTETPAHWVLDISAALPQKLQAALCHRTQHALFVRRASEEAGRPLTIAEVLVGEESLHRVLPPVNGQIPADDPLAQLLRAAVREQSA